MKHRRILTPVQHRLITIITAALAAVGVAAYSYAADTAPSALPGAWVCEPGQPLIVYPGDPVSAGCGPAPTTDPTPSPTSSSSPNPAPTASPTPTPIAPTMTPTPTTTPTQGGRLTGCMTKLATCGYPSPATTGVPAGTTLTNYTGPDVITQNSTVIDGKRITDCLYIQALGVVIRNSVLVAADCFGIVHVESGTVAIENSTLDCIDHRGTGVASFNYIARRVHINRCQNGFDVDGNNVLIEDSYITGVAGGDGHGDGLQTDHGSNIVIRHNTFDLVQDITSSLIMGYTVSNLLVENNFFSSGAYSVYCTRENTNSVYRNNRFYGPVGNEHLDPRRPAYGFATNCVDPGITWTGNFRDDTLSPVSP